MKNFKIFSNVSLFFTALAFSLIIFYLSHLWDHCRPVDPNGFFSPNASVFPPPKKLQKKERKRIFLHLTIVISYLNTISTSKIVWHPSPPKYFFIYNKIEVKHLFFLNLAFFSHKTFTWVADISFFHIHSYTFVKYFGRDDCKA